MKQLAPQLASILLAFAAGCLQVPDAQQVQCTRDSDCASAFGEVCDEGLCWGGPPAGTFAAVVVAPSDRPDLISVELPSQELATDGQLGDVALGTPVTISGRVELFCVQPGGCDGDSIAATVTITRPSLFHGGPGFKAVTSSKEGVPHGGDSFSVSVPRTGPGEPDYVLTVVPDGNGDLPPANGLTAPAEVAPPARMTVAAPSNLDTGTIVLGSENAQVITGNLTDGANHPLAKYRVVAIGRFDAASSPTEVSTVDYTTTGQFAVTLADGVVGPITIKAKPYDANVVAPTLLLVGLDPLSSTHTVAQPAYLGAKLAITIPVEGLSGDGAVKPVSGARVILTGTYAPPLGGGSRAELSTETMTGEDGLAHLMLLDGPAIASTYKLSIVPPAGSNLGIVYDQTFAPDAGAIRLPQRVAIRGRILDRDGNPAGKISVTARPSLRFSWSLDPAAQAFFLSEVPAATTVTPDGGDFVVWVDAAVAGVWGHYDLDFAAPKGVDSASWTRPDSDVPRVANVTALSLGDLTLPDTAFLHGRITDPLGNPVAGGELRILQIFDDTSLCEMVPFEPDPETCVIPAQLLGRGTSDDTGVVKLALPR